MPTVLRQSLVMMSNWVLMPKCWGGYILEMAARLERCRWCCTTFRLEQPWWERPPRSSPQCPALSNSRDLEKHFICQRRWHIAQCAGPLWTRPRLKLLQGPGHKKARAIARAFSFTSTSVRIRRQQSCSSARTASGRRDDDAMPSCPRRPSRPASWQRSTLPGPTRSASGCRRRCPCR